MALCTHYDRTHFLKPVHESKPVDHRCKHTHRVPGRTVNSLVATLQASENISSSDNQANLYAHIGNGFDLLANVFQRLCVNGFALTPASQYFSADLKDDSLVLGSHGLSVRRSNILDFEWAMFIVCVRSLVV